MTSWIVTTSPENFARTRELGFTMQGFKTRQRKNVMERMAPGDEVAVYLTGIQVFAGILRVTSEGFEDHELVWRSKPGEDYPYRVHVEPVVVHDEARWVPSEEVAPALEYVGRWPAEHWKLAFRGNLHLVPDADLATLRTVLGAPKQRATAKKSTAKKATAPKKTTAPKKATAKTTAKKSAAKKATAPKKPTAKKTTRRA